MIPLRLDWFALSVIVCRLEAIRFHSLPKLYLKCDIFSRMLFWAYSLNFGPLVVKLDVEFDGHAQITPRRVHTCDLCTFCAHLEWLTVF